MHASHSSTNHAPRPLNGIRILSLALNLPGPAALMRCQQMGAHCSKLEPVAASDHVCADPMFSYSPQAYAQLHTGIHVLQANLKTEQGQRTLQSLLSQTDVLMTSFRPSALPRLGLDWECLHHQHPQLCMVRIVGSTIASEIDHPGHDLTYQAQAGLIHNRHMPSSLLADMAGAITATEAVMQCLLLRLQTGHGHCLDIGLAQAAQWLALPRHWKLSTIDGDVGGAHAGYRMYSCLDGWVALAALEPHFAQRLCELAGLENDDGSAAFMRAPSTHDRIASFMQTRSCSAIAAIAEQSDIPLQVIYDISK